MEGVLQPYFEECNAFMKKALGEGSAVLVHCHRGMSRSSTMVIAYMMAEMGMSLEDAHVLVKASATSPLLHTQRSTMNLLSRGHWWGAPSPVMFAN